MSFFADVLFKLYKQVYYNDLSWIEHHDINHMTPRCYKFIDGKIIWSVDTEWNRKVREESNNLSIKDEKGKILTISKGNYIRGAEIGDIDWVMGEFSKSGRAYYYRDAENIDNRWPNESHSIKEVLYGIINDPQNFSIGEFEKQYSKQEIDYFNDIQTRCKELNKKVNRGISKP